MKKATCITRYKQLEGVFDKGDKVVIETIPYEKDTILVHEQTRHNKETGRVEISSPAVIAQKGSYKDFQIKSKNGNYYSGDGIKNMIGYVPLSKIFKLKK